MISSNELRNKFIKFFKENGHQQIPAASLAPENDPSVLFTTAGMHPLVPFLLGEKHPAGKRLVNYQKCIRTGDIDEVGNNHHLTFFEMLGNWSLGDPASPNGIGEAGYWKKEAIRWSFEFLTNKKWLSLNPKKLAISVFEGDNDSPFDEESSNIWRDLGIPAKRIAKLGKEDNWWPTGGKSLGPQGPDTEIFYWTSPEPVPETFNPQDNRWFEIWNNVFMEYNLTAENKYEQLKQKNVDTGMGLERTIVALNNLENVYQIDTLKPIYEQAKDLAREFNEKALRIIVDHLRASVFIIADGIVPSNLKQGYVLRRLLRRIIRYGSEIKMTDDFMDKLTEIIVQTHKTVYSTIEDQRSIILEVINKEKDVFEKTLANGLKEFKKLSINKIITGEQAFYLYSTYGFPIEMIIELANEQNLEVDLKGYESEFKKHQDRSRTATAGMFKGGLHSQSEMTIKYHTATHLLHAALRRVLGEHAQQKGSNITDERLRFDFSHPVKMSEVEIKKVEDLVNQMIKKNLPVTYEEISLADAKQSGALGFFAEKYGDKVKVYTIGNPSQGREQVFSKEICGGPHVENTGILGHFKIIKEEASSADIRRIKAIIDNFC